MIGISLALAIKLAQQKIHDDRIHRGYTQDHLTRGDGGKIEAGELGNLGIKLQEEGEGLANATGGTEHGDLEATLLLGSERSPLHFGE